MSVVVDTIVQMSSVSGCRAKVGEFVTHQHQSCSCGRWLGIFIAVIRRAHLGNGHHHLDPSGKFATHLRALRQCQCTMHYISITCKKWGVSERKTIFLWESCEHSNSAKWTHWPAGKCGLNGVRCGSAMVWTKMLMPLSLPFLCPYIWQSAFSWILTKKPCRTELQNCWRNSVSPRHFLVLRFRPLTVLFSCSVPVLIIAVNKVPLRRYFRIVGLSSSENCCSVY